MSRYSRLVRRARAVSSRREHPQEETGEERAERGRERGVTSGDALIPDTGGVGWGRGTGSVSVAGPHARGVGGNGRRCAMESAEVKEANLVGNGANGGVARV